MTGSYSFITVHNHPNNNPQKSDADIQSDAYLKQIADLLNITYREGLVITKKQVDDLHRTAWKEEKERFDEEDEYGDDYKEYVALYKSQITQQYDQSYDREA